VAYGTLEHRFWEDDDLKETGLECRAVAGYVLTCRHSTSEGYYRLPLGYASDDLAIARDVVLDYLRVLDLKEFCRYDEGSQVVFIRNAMRYRPPKGDRSCIGALRRATDVPANPFRGLFYDAATQFAPEFADVLRGAGWCSEEQSELTLFKHTPPVPVPAPAVLAPPPPRELDPAPVDHIEEILTMAASISVQQSIANRETIRNPAAVAQARLTSKRAEWTAVLDQWLGYWNVAPADMARALADGGKASPYWARLNA
jgi:hypothetical protein